VKTLLKYNTSAVIATLVDYTLFIVLSEIFNVWYLLSSVIGLVAGGVTSFLLERSWTFNKTGGKLSKQAVRYFITWIISIVLNSAGLYIMVEYASVQYIISKIIVSALVGIGFNFLMHKHFVFG